jgi:hypothetical protein
MGMTYTVGNQVYLGVDYSTVLPDTDTGRKSIWLESKDSFWHGLLIGDFAHVPGSICGLWPGLYVSRILLRHFPSHRSEMIFSKPKDS